jgi:uncharacterized protein with PIN domain
VRREEEQNTSASHAPHNNLRFIADAMLGRLARWLRFLGFDTLYYPDISDRRLIRIAIEQNRLILTRDTRLVKTKAARDSLLITANDTFGQLIEVVNSLGLKEFKPVGRCLKCNGQLTEITDKAEVKDSVPEFVFLNYDTFLRCHNCGKIYWEGTHPRKFREKLGSIIKQT